MKRTFSQVDSTEFREDSDDDESIDNDSVSPTLSLPNLNIQPQDNIFFVGHSFSLPNLTNISTFSLPNLTNTSKSFSTISHSPSPYNSLTSISSSLSTISLPTSPYNISSTMEWYNTIPSNLRPTSFQGDSVDEDYDAVPEVPPPPFLPTTLYTKMLNVDEDYDVITPPSSPLL